MRPTYADIALLIDAAETRERAPSTPLLGLLTGLTLALLLWSGVGWLFWAAFA